MRASRCRWRPSWTAGLEYLYTRYGNSTVGYANAGQTSQSDLSLQELRLTLNYRPGADQNPGNDAASWFAPSEDRVQFSRPEHIRLAGLSGDPLAL